MAGGILISVKSNHPIFYLIGILVFLVLGIVIAILGFTGMGGGVGGGIFGIVLAAAAVILFIEYLVTR